MERDRHRVKRKSEKEGEIYSKKSSPEIVEADKSKIFKAHTLVQV